MMTFGSSLLRIKVIKKNSTQKLFQAQSLTYLSEKNFCCLRFKWMTYTEKNAHAFQRMFGILERWNNNQVMPSLSKPHGLSYRSNTTNFDHIFKITFR